MSACTRILGLEGTPEGVEDQGKLTRVAAVCSPYPSSNCRFRLEGILVRTHGGLTSSCNAHNILIVDGSFLLMH